MMVYGHRGLSSLAPENTLAAFRLLPEHNVPGVELDVYRCGSGEIVVAHDKDLKRTAGVDLLIEETSFSRLSEYDVGSWLDDQFASERIPLLKDVFALLGSRIKYDIEIKPHQKHPEDSQVEDLVVDLIQESGLSGSVMISSFDPFVVRKTRLAAARRGFKLPVAVIYSDHPEMPWFLRKGQGRLIAGARVMKPDHKDLTPRRVRRHHRRGRTVLPWTVDDTEIAKQLVQMGVDELVSNRPHEILAALATD